MVVEEEEVVEDDVEVEDVVVVEEEVPAWSGQVLGWEEEEVVEVVVVVVLVLVMVVVLMPLDHGHHVALGPRHGWKVPQGLVLHHRLAVWGLEWRGALPALLPVSLVAVGLWWGLWRGLWEVVAVLRGLGGRGSRQVVAKGLPRLAAACQPQWLPWALGGPEELLLLPLQPGLYVQGPHSGLGNWHGMLGQHLGPAVMGSMGVRLLGAGPALEIGGPALLLLPCLLRQPYRQGTEDGPMRGPEPGSVLSPLPGSDMCSRSTGGGLTRGSHPRPAWWPGQRSDRHRP